MNSEATPGEGIAVGTGAGADNRASTPTPPVERLLTIEAAAELTSFDKAVIIGWMERGLPYVPGKDGKIRPRLKDRRIRLSELWAWIDTITINKREAAKAPAVALPSSGGLSAWRERKG